MIAPSMTHSSGYTAAIAAAMSPAREPATVRPRTPRATPLPGPASAIRASRVSNFAGRRIRRQPTNDGDTAYSHGGMADAHEHAVEPAVAPPPGNPRFAPVDGLRAVAACAVVVTHTAFLSGF